MLKKLAKGFLFFIALLMLIIIFLPKKNLYYLLETELLKHKVIISDETTEDMYAYLDIKSGTIYYDGIEAGLVGEIKVFPFLFANLVNINNASFSNELSNIIPQKIENLKIYYTLIDPLNINIDGNGDFGSIFGFINISSRELFLELTPSEVMHTKYRGILQKFKKVEERYVFSTKF